MTHPQTQDDEALVEVMAKAAYMELYGPDDEPDDWWGEDDWHEYHLPARLWDEDNISPHIGTDGFRRAAQAALNALRNHEGRK